MKFSEILEELKEQLKFLELKTEKSVANLVLPSGYFIPINRESVSHTSDDKTDFNILKVIQNMMFCASFCDDLPFQESYEIFLKDFFEEGPLDYQDAMLDLSAIENPLYKCGILISYGKYKFDSEALGAASSILIDYFHSEEDSSFLDKAEEYLIESLKLSESAYSAYLLSYIYNIKEDYELALEYAEAALMYKPSEELKSALENDIKEVKILHDICISRDYMDEGDYIGAQKYLEENASGENWEQELMLGEIHLALQRPDLAFERLKKALELNPTEADIYESIGVASYLIGDVTNSIKFFEHGLRIDAKHNEILKNLSILYSRTGRADIALKLLEKARKFYPEDDEITKILEQVSERLD